MFLLFMTLVYNDVMFVRKLNLSSLFMYHVQCTMYHVQCIMYNVSCTMYNVHATYIMITFNVHCTLYIVHYIV